MRVLHHPFFLLPPVSYSLPPNNHVHWNPTPDSHLFSTELPGVRKEEIRVEVEDSLYLVIRTELLPSAGTAEEPVRKSFKRKFRLPGMVDVDGISAGYEHGVLTVRVPRTVTLSSRTLPASELRAAAGGDGRGNNSVARAA